MHPKSRRLETTLLDSRWQFEEGYYYIGGKVRKGKSVKYVI
jgi:hypothetical protein